MVVKILSDCGSKDWATIAFQYSTTPPHPEIPRWSVFDLAFQQCQWSMDFAHLAVKEINKLAIGSSDWMFIYPGLHWREERQREVQQTTEVLSGSLAVAATLEGSKRALLHEATGVLLMELMEGDLRDLMDQRCLNPGPDSRPFPLVVALDIMLQIAEAMRFVHEHKILHRDLKTTNILFNTASSGAIPSYPTLNVDRIRELELLYLLTPERFYTVKLADFDLAMHSPNESSQIVDAKIGTPRYMAPETFYNPEAEVPSMYNWSCDVYSFAMTCSAILTGNEPFHDIEKSTRFDIMASVVDGMAERQVRPDLGLGDALPSLKSLIERCWDKDPLQRPRFSEICEELWDCKVKATISCLWRR